jgi:hypothetical protein
MSEAEKRKEKQDATRRERSHERAGLEKKRGKKKQRGVSIWGGTYIIHKITYIIHEKTYIIYKII